MAKKQNEEEKLLEDTAKLIMHIIHVVSVRLAGRYERKLMTELVGLMQTKLEANEEVSNPLTITLLNNLTNYRNNPNRHGKYRAAYQLTIWSHPAKPQCADTNTHRHAQPRHYNLLR